MMSAFVPLLGTLRNFANSTNIAFFIFFRAASFGNGAGPLEAGSSSDSVSHSTSSWMAAGECFGSVAT